MSVATAPVTPDDLLRMGSAGKGYELVDGELKELIVSTRSCYVGGRVYSKLENYSESQSPGWAFPPETGYRCFADDTGRVRKPDASFILLDRMTREEYEADGFTEVVPDLVAEVISPNDIAADLDAKVEEWLAAGVRLVWVVNPELRTVRVYRPDGTGARLQVGDTLTADPVLPGFSCPVADLFRLPGGAAPPGPVQ